MQSNFSFFLNLRQLVCFLLLISKKKLIDEIAEEPHFSFNPFETWQQIQAAAAAACNCREGAALSCESVNPLTTILYVVSL